MAHAPSGFRTPTTGCEPEGATTEFLIDAVEYIHAPGSALVSTGEQVALLMIAVREIKQADACFFVAIPVAIHGPHKGACCLQDFAGVGSRRDEGQGFAGVVLRGTVLEPVRVEPHPRATGVQTTGAQFFARHDCEGRHRFA